MTIRTKLIMWYSGLLAFIIILFGLAVFWFMRWTLIASIDQTLDETATQVIDNSRAFPIGEFSSPSSVSVQLPPLDVFRASGVYVQVWDISQDEPLFAAASANIQEFEVALDPAALASSEIQFRNVSFNSAELRVLTYPVVLPNGIHFASVQVAESLQQVNQAVDRLLTIMMILMGTAIIASSVVGLILATRVLAPIDAIIEGAATITETDDLSTRLPWQGPMDELGRLTSVFNRMMNRLEHLFSVQKRFVADVSHELRTPLTAIRGNLDLIERYGADDDSMEAISSEVDRMARMVEDLLLLARADYGGLTLDIEPLDLDTVVSEAYRQATAIVRGKKRDLSIQMGRFEPVRINGNADRITQLLLNLVSNAVKFTPDGGTITLSLSEEGNYAVMRVRDTGIGISEPEQAQIFDRFFQAESSRANINNESGTGLGLSICKWIVEAHGGNIKVDSQLRVGTTFTIAIPKMIHTQATLHGKPIRDEVRQAYKQSLQQAKSTTK